MVRKIVRFYDTVIIDQDENRHHPDENFWRDLLQSLEHWDLAQRTATIRNTDYFGHSSTPLQPATTHLQVERVRSPSEQLNQSNIATGQVLPLDLHDPDERVTEPTYVVPFGTRARVAVLSPAARGTRYETISRWLTQVLQLPQQGMSMLLLPVVDPRMIDRIVDADGAVILDVTLDHDEIIPAEGGGDVGDAFRNAQRDDLRSASLSFRWSLGRRGGTETSRAALKEGALWVARNGVGRTSKVKLVEEERGGALIRDELRDIVADRISKQITFDLHEDRRAQESEIVSEINEAIGAFLQEGEDIGFQDFQDAQTINLETITPRD